MTKHIIILFLLMSSVAYAQFPYPPGGEGGLSTTGLGRWDLTPSIQTDTLTVSVKSDVAGTTTSSTGIEIANYTKSIGFQSNNTFFRMSGLGFSMTHAYGARLTFPNGQWAGKLWIREASFNNYDATAHRLQVDGGLKVDTVISSIQRWDTLGVQASDSSYFWVTRVDEPITYVSEYSATYPRYKQGSITFKIPAEGYSGPWCAAFKSDSANGVHIMAARIKSYGGRGHYIGEAYLNGFEEWVDLNPYTVVDWGSTSNSKHPRLRGFGVAISEYMRGFSVMGTLGNQTEGTGVIEAEVFFRMDADDNSDWYVTIVDY